MPDTYPRIVYPEGTYPEGTYPESTFPRTASNPAASLLALNPNLLLLASPPYCFTDAGGTVPAGNGDPVRVWKDYSGNGLDLSQATLANRPTLVSVSGKWAVRFVNTSPSYMSNGTGVGGTQNAVALTIGAAMNPLSVSEQQVLDLASSFAVFTNANNVGNYGWYEGAWRDSGITSVLAPQTVVWKPNSGVNVGTIRKNGTNIITNLAYTPGGTSLNRIFVGANNGAGSAWGGDLYGLFIKKADMTGTDLTDLESNLTALRA